MKKMKFGICRFGHDQGGGIPITVGSRTVIKDVYLQYTYSEDAKGSAVDIDVTSAMDLDFQDCYPAIKEDCTPDWDCMIDYIDTLREDIDLLAEAKAYIAAFEKTLTC